MAKTETKQAPAAAQGEATQDAAVKMRILKTGTEVDGWRYAAGAIITATPAQAAALEAAKAALRVY